MTMAVQITRDKKVTQNKRQYQEYVFFLHLTLYGKGINGLELIIPSVKTLK